MTEKNEIKIRDILNYKSYSDYSESIKPRYRYKYSATYLANYFGVSKQTIYNSRNAKLHIYKLNKNGIDRFDIIKAFNELKELISNELFY